VTERTWALAFTPDGQYLVAVQTVSRGHSALGVWSVASGALIQTLAAPPDVPELFGLAFSPTWDEMVGVGNGVVKFKYRSQRLVPVANATSRVDDKH
jgi:WD40 repeat protein